MPVFRTVRCIALTLAAVMTVGLTGCSDLLDDESSDDSRTSRNDTLTISGIPRSADLLEEGRGTLSVRAADDGRVYLFDAEDGRVVWSGRIEKGQRFTVSPDNDRAAIDGQVVYERNLERKHTHRVYFDRS
jgi:hypothetical protein